MPLRRLALLAGLLAASGCSDFIPFAVLELRVAVTPDSLLPIAAPPDTGWIRITVINRTGAMVSIPNTGCGISYVIEAIAPTPEPAHSSCTPGDFDRDPVAPTDLAPGDSVVVERPFGGRDWSGIPLAGGRYRIRGTFPTEHFTSLGNGGAEITILNWARVRWVHSVGGVGPVDLMADGRVVVRNLEPGTVSPVVFMVAGPIEVELRRAGEGTTLDRFPVILREGVARVLGVRRTDGTHAAVDLTDSAVVAGPNQTRLRVVHLAETARDIEVLYSRPGSAGPTPIIPQLPYGAESAYLAGGVGDWRLTAVSAASGDTLLTAAFIPLAGGVVRTVVLVDRPGGGGSGSRWWSHSRFSRLRGRPEGRSAARRGDAQAANSGRWIRHHFSASS